MAIKRDNRKLYRELSAPQPSMQDAERLAEEFSDALYELRVKFKIPNMYVIFGIPYTTDEGDDDAERLSCIRAGDMSRMLGMTASAFASERAAVQQELDRLTGSKHSTLT